MDHIMISMGWGAGVVTYPFIHVVCFLIWAVLCNCLLSQHFTPVMGGGVTCVQESLMC